MLSALLSHDYAFIVSEPKKSNWHGSPTMSSGVLFFCSKVMSRTSGFKRRELLVVDEAVITGLKQTSTQNHATWCACNQSQLGNTRRVPSSMGAQSSQRPSRFHRSCRPNQEGRCSSDSLWVAHRMVWARQPVGSRRQLHGGRTCPVEEVRMWRKAAGCAIAPLNLTLAVAGAPQNKLQRRVTSA